MHEFSVIPREIALLGVFLKQEVVIHIGNRLIELEK